MKCDLKHFFYRATPIVIYFKMLQKSYSICAPNHHITLSEGYFLCCIALLFKGLLWLFFSVRLNTGLTDLVPNFLLIPSPVIFLFLALSYLPSHTGLCPVPWMHQEHSGLLVFEQVSPFLGMLFPKVTLWLTTSPPLALWSNTIWEPPLTHVRVCVCVYILWTKCLCSPQIHMLKP